MTTTNDPSENTTQVASQGIAAPVGAPPQQGEPKLESAATTQMLMQAAVSLLVSALVAIIGVVAYLNYVPKAQRIATVDINEIMQVKQIMLTASVSRPGATDKDREAAYDEIGRFGQTLEASIAELNHECDCVLLVRAAVIKGADDLTPALKAKVGIGGTSVQEAISVLRGAQTNGAQQSPSVATPPAGSGPAPVTRESQEPARMGDAAREAASLFTGSAGKAK